MALEKAPATEPLPWNGNNVTTSVATLQTALAALLLLAGVVNDLRSRQVRNQIVIVGFVVGLVFMISTQGFTGLMVATLSVLTAAAAVLPLYLMRVLGGGDVKLYLSVSVLLGWQSALITLIGSIIWGSILGITQVLLKGQGKAFAHNMMALANRAKLQETQVHKIPFTVALLFGFLTSMVWMGGL